jgi:outer membrane lipoprotein-sorting protein
MLKNGSRRLVLLTLFLGCVQFAAAQTADDIIEKDLAALGGRTALSNLRSRSMKGTITGSRLASIGLTGSVEILNEVPNKSRSFVQIDLSGLGLGKFVHDQRFDGTSGYVIDTMEGNHDITGEQLDAMKNAQFPSPLLNYKGMGTTVELAGKEKVGDRDAYVLIGKPKAGPVIRYYIDAETYLPIRSVMKIMVPQLGTEVEQTTETSDFREVDSVKVPFRIMTTSSLQTVLVTITQVEQNKQIDQSLFSKPDANTGK